MTALAWVLIFGVGYPLVAIAVACAGVFAIAVTRPERVAEAKASQQYKGGPNDSFWFKLRYRELLNPLIGTTIIAAIFWPFAVPMWFAWKKGDFVAQALESRQAKDVEALSYIKGGAA